MDKEKIIGILEEIAVLLEIQGANAFKVRAYANGARSLERSDEPLEKLVGEGRLSELSGVGEALAKKIETLHREGRLDYYDNLREEVPDGLLEMMSIPGLGGKSIHRLNRELGVETLDELKAACEDGRVVELKGFGEKSAKKILSGMKNREAYSGRYDLETAEQTAQPILEGLRKLSGVAQAEIAGSLRRRKETVGDLDFIVSSREPGKVMDWFVQRPEVIEVVAKGTTKSSVRLEGGMQADLRVVEDHQYGPALHHFTGSKDHNVWMRRRALERNQSLSEWGLFEDKGAGKTLPVNSEKELFAALDLPWIPPELREGFLEMKWATENQLPQLVDLDSIQGVLHNHTVASDGKASIEDMARAAAAYGWKYLGISDHSRSSYQANGLSEERLLQQVEEIRKLNEGGQLPLHIFAGVECDILKDGRLDYSNEVLAQLDFVIVSIHAASYGSDKDTVTPRVIKALENPATTFLAHPTGRILLGREPYAIDLKKVLDAAVANGKWVEINGNPHRMDLDWREWQAARERGILACVNPDAHSVEGLSHTRYGVDVARKAGLTASEVINTKGLQEMKKLLAR